MDFLRFRDYAFLSQASYRNLTAVPRGADARALEVALTVDGPNVLSPGNRFAAAQAKMLTGSTTADPTDGYSLLHQTPDGARGFSARVFASNDGQRTVVAVRGTGTEPNSVVDDILNADFLGLVLRQAAYGQVADAYRYYKQLITPQNQSVQYSEAERAELELTPFRGHLILTEKGVRHADDEAAVPGGVQAADGRAGARWAHTGRAWARVQVQRAEHLDVGGARCG